MSIRKSAVALASAGAISVLASAFPPVVAGAGLGPQEPQAPTSAPQKEAEDQRPTEAKIRELMKVTGQAELGIEVMDAMLDAFEQMGTMPPGFVDEFKKAAKPEDLVNMVVPIIRRHVDAKTLEATLVYAKSDAGKKWFKAQQPIAKESQAAGQAWGQKLAMEVMMKLQRR